MGLVPVTAKMSEREVELLEAVAKLEGRSRSNLVRAAVAARVRDRLAAFVVDRERPEFDPAA